VLQILPLAGRGGALAARGGGGALATRALAVRGGGVLVKRGGVVSRLQALAALSSQRLGVTTGVGRAIAKCMINQALAAVDGPLTQTAMADGVGVAFRLSSARQNALLSATVKRYIGLQTIAASQAALNVNLGPKVPVGEAGRGTLLFPQLATRGGGVALRL